MLSFLVALLAFVSNVSAESLCVDKSAIEWRSYNNQIMLNGYRFNMKGLSWFGFETGNYNLYGLDVHSVDWYFQWMVDNGFNAMRLPFSQDFMNSGTSNRNAYKAVVQTAGTYGILVMLDFHSATAGAWTDGLYTINQANAIAIWEMVADLVGDQYNVFLADVFNEPHDVTNDQWADWINFCENVAAALFAKGVNWMIAVEGTNSDCTSLGADTYCAWGENLMGVKSKGVTFDYSNYGSNRFLWSPHVYGGDVTGNWVYSTTAWQQHWGYLVDGSYSSNKAASVIGEFGTKYEGSMVSWLNSLVNYLIQIDQRNTFFWCLNPNSGDTGGLLQDDWTTPQSAKLAQLTKLQPTPTTISYDSSSGQVCFENLGTASSSGSTSTTTTTTTTTSSGGSGSGIKIAIKNGANKWWFAVTLDEDGNAYPSIDWIKMKDSTMSSFVAGVQEWDYYKWTSGPYTGPFSFQISRNGVTSTAYSVISNSEVVYGNYGYMTVNSAYTEDDSTSGAGTLAWTSIFAIVVAALVCCACIVGGVIYCRRRRNKGVATFQETAGVDDEEENRREAGTTTRGKGVENEDDPEIEVEMNMLEDAPQNSTVQ
mmetsp:Transcript_47437/g.76100  ORF Transcript_47437/g.76100 Transcript_47437/m.76100 type:complete len:594 (+) Transcript_47437:78-1859(+)